MPASLNVTDISVLASKKVILNIQRNLSIFSGLRDAEEVRNISYSMKF